MGKGIESPCGERLKPVRAMIASRMKASLEAGAQLSYFADVDVTTLLQSRKEWKAAGHAIGIEDCIIAALSLVLRDFPEFNATLSDGLISVTPVQDIAVAISTDTGLMTPIIRDAGALSLTEIGKKRRDLVQRGRAGTLKVSEMKGGSFTISNLGLTRVRHFTPILNHPQVALLGLGRIEDRYRPDGAGWAVSRIMGLSLTADHQWLDGEPCGRFLEALCDALEDFSPAP
ncbi:MAG: 2-oxo acid dehydrogenase subunit E2 [Pseudomonadota bacterium]